MMPRCWAAVLIATALLCEPAAAGKGERSGDFFFKDGDVVVIMGDSITEQRLYSSYVEMWTVSRFPAWKLVFRNVGIGGDRSPGGNGRFKRDVLAHRATAMTVDFGMNDGGYRPFDQKTFETYMKGLQGIADQARAAQVRVAWITPQPVEHYPVKDSKKEEYNQTLEKFSAGVGEIARKNGGLFVDQFHPYWGVVEKARAAGEKGRITAGDAVHPGPPGQAVMAWAILKGLHFPRLVSSAEIALVDKGQPAVRAENCKLAEIAARQADGGATAVSFSRHDRALPFFPAEAKGILKWAPVLEDLNDYRLKVTGLKPGKYEVRLEGKKVAAYTAAELATGVNLAAPALAVGPVADQVKAVWKAVLAKTDYYHDQVFRGVLLAPAKSPLFKDVPPKDLAARRQAAYEERMQKMPELDAAIRQALAMRPHRVEIVAAAD
jgi:lysophospholipase L1-like esterase